MDFLKKLEDMLTCQVCQDMLKDPWQLACGHSFCRSCLKNRIDHSETALLLCPTCDQVLSSKNYPLGSLVEEYREFRRRNIGLFDYNMEE